MEFLLLFVAIHVVIWVTKLLLDRRAQERASYNREIELSRINQFRNKIQTELDQIMTHGNTKHLDVILDDVLRYNAEWDQKYHQKLQMEAERSRDHLQLERSEFRKIINPAIEQLRIKVDLESENFNRSGKTQFLSAKKCKELIKLEERTMFLKEPSSEFPAHTNLQVHRLRAKGLSDEEIQHRIISNNTKNAKNQRKQALIAAADGNARKVAESIKRKLPVPTLCPYCQNPSDTWRADHIIPVAQGGLSTMGNMVNVCESCNTRKKDVTLRSFCKSAGFDYIAVIERLEHLGKTI